MCVSRWFRYVRCPLSSGLRHGFKGAIGDLGVGRIGRSKMTVGVVKSLLIVKVFAKFLPDQLIFIECDLAERVVFEFQYIGFDGSIL